MGLAVPYSYEDLIKAALPMLKAQSSLHEFVIQAWPIIEPKEPFVDGMHIKAVCRHLEAVSKGLINRLIINVPPRTSKSSIISVIWPTWDWLFFPWRKFLYASHSYKISKRDSLRCKKIIKDRWYQKNWGHLFNLVKDTESYFENNLTGFRNITSVTSSATGENADIIVADDLNDTKKVFSDLIRDNTNTFFSSTLSMRLNDRKRGAIVIVQQRSHEVDVSGFVMLDDKDNRWVKLILPMEYVSKRKCVTVPLAPGEKAWEDPRTVEGQLLWPEKIDEEGLIDIKQTLKSEYNISGQLQQIPSPEAGGIIKKSYFQWWKKPNPPKLTQIIQSWDTALTEDDRKKNAYSACTTWGVFEDFGEDHKNNSGQPNIILLEAWRGRLEYPELRKMAQRLALDYRDKGNEPREPDGKHVPDYLLVEAKSSGSPLIQDLRRAGVLATSFIPDKFGDKTERVRLCTPIMECGRVWLPANPFSSYKTLLPFAELFEEQCIKFPNAESRDWVDTMTQVLLRVIYNGILTNSNDSIKSSSISYPKHKFYSPTSDD